MQFWSDPARVSHARAHRLVRLARVAFVAAFCLAAMQSLYAAEDVVPSFAADREGDVFTSAPFSTGDMSAPSLRYQGVYESEEFGAWAGPRQ